MTDRDWTVWGTGPMALNFADRIAVLPVVRTRVTSVVANY